MLKISLFKNIDLKGLKILENLILIIWLQYLIIDQYSNLYLLDSRLFYPRGIFRLVEILKINFEPNQYLLLVILQICLILLVIYYMYKKRRSTFLIFLLLIYIYELIKKGFGGHIDHRIITLYLFTIIFYISNNTNTVDNQSKILPPYLFFITQYFFIGFARLINGFPTLFINNTMGDWLIQRSLRQNFYNLEIGLILSNTLHPIVLNFFLIITTIVEMSLVLTLFKSKKYTVIILLIMSFTHLGIFLLMGINFIENVFLLISFAYLTYKYEFK